MSQVLMRSTSNRRRSFRCLEPGGHTVSASASVEHALSRNLKFQIGYDRLEESYAGIAVAVPNFPTATASTDPLPISSPDL